MSGTEHQPTNDRAPRPRWLWPVLFTSLAINLLIAGIVMGWLMSPGGDRRDHRPERGLIGEPFARALDKDTRRALLRDIVRESRSLRENRESLRARVAALLVAIRAESYDEDAIKNLLSEQRQAALARQDIGERLLLERLAAMSQTERAAYADRLEGLLRRLRPRSN